MRAARVTLVAIGIAVAGLAASGAGCTGLVGDFGLADLSDGGPQDGPLPAPDCSAACRPDGGGDARPPPPVAGKPGLDTTAGGNTSKSTGYKLVGAVGEGPGNNVVSKSPAYKLKGGVVASTQ
jgi:hypothetical protein